MANKSVVCIEDGIIKNVGSSDAVAMADGDFRIGLGDTAGARTFAINDSAGVIVITINSDGEAIIHRLEIDDDAANPPLKITARSAAPTAPETGDIYLDDGTNTASTSPGFRRYTGSAWEDIGAVAGGGGGSVGGVYGINVETLSADKTLTANTDKIYQYLNPGSNRTINMVSTDAIAGDRFVIKDDNSVSASEYLTIQNNGTIIDYLYSQTEKEYIFDGTNWRSALASQDVNDGNTALGYKTNVYNNGTAVGYNADGHYSGVAIGFNTKGYVSAVAIGYAADGSINGAVVGYNAKGSSYGVAVGNNADGSDHGVAVGYHTSSNLQKYSIALGYYSKNIRYSEIATNINGADHDQENNMMTVGFELETTSLTDVEMYCGGYSGKRMDVRASSILSFKIQVAYRDNTSGECGVWYITGAAKRDGSNNTTGVGSITKTEIGNDNSLYDCAVSIDDTNDAVVIMVHNGAGNTTQWTARLDGVETHF